MMRDKFAIFIISRGRPNKIYTLETLEKMGYSGKYYILVDDDDETKREYIKNYGKSKVIILDKSKAPPFDIMDNFPKPKPMVYARNVCWDVARALGLEYIAMFEDDYVDIQLRYEKNGELKGRNISNFNLYCDIMIEFVDTVSRVQPLFRSIAFAQGGDFIGGCEGQIWKQVIRRKSMNSFFFKVHDNPDDDVLFRGRMNDDVNTYVSDGMTGGLWFQIALVCVTQKNTQIQGGGCTSMYIEMGTYVKSMYTVMLAPSAVRISLMGNTNMRIHHAISFNNLVPKILNQSWQRK